MKIKASRYILLILTSGIAITLGTGVQAQEDESEFILDEVMVTAQRRTENLQDVPLAVTTFSGEDIESRGWLRPADVAQQVPNMQISSPFGDVQPLFAIRGVSMISYNPSQASPIGVYADETYIGATYLHGLSIFDMERVEVSRGPQGTLYGKNTTGGAINLSSQSPDIDAGTSGYTTLGIGDYGTQYAKAAVEGTLAEGTLAGRIAINYRENDGFYDNHIGPDMAQTKHYAARLTLNYQPNDQFNALLKITSGESTPRHSPPRAEGTAVGGVNHTGNTEVINPGFLEGSVDEIGKTEVDLNLVNLKLTYELENYSLISVTSYYDGGYQQKQDLDGTSEPFFGMDWGSDTEAVSQDIRLVSEYDGPFNFIIGAYYGDEEINTDILHEDFFGVFAPPNLTNNPLITLVSDGVWGSVHRRVDVVKESLAAYTHMTYDFTEKLGLTVGLRYTEDDVTLDHYNISRINGRPLVVPTPGGPLVVDPRTEGTWIGGSGNPTGIDSPIIPPGFPGALTWTHGVLTDASAPKRSETENEFTGTVALNYQISDDVLSYVKYSRGFRAGTYGEDLVYLDAGDGLYAKPEYIDAYELGMKGEFLNSRLRLNAALFYYDYTDQQFSNNVGLSAYLVNAGRTDISGLELELLAALTEGWTVQAGLGLLDAEFKELELSDLSTPQDLSDTIDLSGNTPVSTPDVNFNIASDYETSLFDSYKLRLHVDGTYIDDQWFSAYNDQQGFKDIRQDAYWDFNAHVAFSDAAEKYTVSFWINNIANEEYDVFSINLQTAAGYNYFAQGAPRTYGADFTVRF
jgi:iron complex outermembrane receptor protein